MTFKTLILSPPHWPDRNSLGREHYNPCYNRGDADFINQGNIGTDGE